MEGEPAIEQRGRFTWRELLVLLSIAALLIAALIPSILNGIEAARRTSCNGNLKQTGLGIQNFHDIRREICPSYLTDDHSPAALPRGYANWPVLLMPYIEQLNVYELVDVSVPLDQRAEPPADHATAVATGLMTYFCYTRRTTWHGPFAVGDYACVSLSEAAPGKVDRTRPRTWDGAMVPCRVFNASKSRNEQSLSDFEPGTLAPREFRSLTTFNSIVDGLSNTAFVGEKAIRAGRLGGHGTDLARNALPSEQDGPYYYGRGGNPADLAAPGAMAWWSRRLAPQNPAERLIALSPREEDPNNRFGSWHPGITLFLLGDGSVRQVHNATSTVILQRLGCRNDRQEFHLP